MRPQEVIASVEPGARPATWRNVAAIASLTFVTGSILLVDGGRSLA